MSGVREEYLQYALNQPARATELPGLAEAERKPKRVRSPEYMAWIGLRRRCTHPEMTCYKNYGGRGIQVCERWMTSFANFYADMGPRPSPRHSIDRIDNDGNYEPGNCRWATKLQQLNNKRLGPDAGIFRKNGKFRVSVGHVGRTVYFGTYLTIEEAREVRKAAFQKLKDGNYK